MSESEHQRIRQVAAAIAQMDADSAEQLIGHFPIELQAKVRKEIERIEVETVVVAEGGKRVAVGRGTTLDVGQGIADRATQDSRVEFHEVTGGVVGGVAGLDHSVQNLLGRSVDDFVWLESYTSEQLAGSLSTLRPVVAAMILKHLPLEIGTRIVQLLPSTFARTCMNAVQSLHSAHPEACSIVLSQWRLDLADQVGRQTVERRDDEKVRELLKALVVNGANSVSESFQSTSVDSHGSTDGSRDTVSRLPADLGLGVEASATVIPMVSAAAIQGAVQVSSKGTALGMPSDSNSVVPGSGSNAVKPSYSTNSLGGVKSGTGSAKERLHDSGSFVIPIDRKLTRNELLQDLLQLEDVEFLRVLYQHEPKVVLSFLAGAGKPLRHRIEQLTAPKLLPKLRRELASHRQPSEEEWRGIAMQINQSIRALQSVDATTSNTVNRVSA